MDASMFSETLEITDPVCFVTFLYNAGHRQNITDYSKDEGGFHSFIEGGTRRTKEICHKLQGNARHQNHQQTLERAERAAQGSIRRAQHGKPANSIDHCSQYPEHNSQHQYQYDKENNPAQGCDLSLIHI